MTLVVYNYRCIMVLYLWEFLEQGFRQKIRDLELNWRPGPITLNKKVQTPHCQRQQSSFSTADKRSGSKICMFVSHIHNSHWNYSSEIHRHWQPPQYHQVNVVISENSSTLLWLRTTRFKCKCTNLKEWIRWQQCAARWNQRPEIVILLSGADSPQMPLIKDIFTCTHIFHCDLQRWCILTGEKWMWVMNLIVHFSPFKIIHDR